MLRDRHDTANPALGSRLSDMSRRTARHDPPGEPRRYLPNIAKFGIALNFQAELAGEILQCFGRTGKHGVVPCLQMKGCFSPAVETGALRICATVSIATRFSSTQKPRPASMFSYM